MRVLPASAAAAGARVAGAGTASAGDRRPGRLRLPRLDPEAVSGVVVGPAGRVERVSGRTWLAHRVRDPEAAADGEAATLRVTGDGFWQAHAGAAEFYAGLVLAALSPAPGDVLADLYAGAGLFTTALAATGASVVAVEADDRAAADLRRNVHGQERVRVVHDTVERALGLAAGRDAGRSGLHAQGDRAGSDRAASPAVSPTPSRTPSPTIGREPSAAVPERLDGVVVDPPRAGAGRRVVEALTARRPRRLVYVACDPASLARDTALLREGGFELADLRAVDAFPMTHHVECLATFAPS